MDVREFVCEVTQQALENRETRRLVTENSAFCKSSVNS